MQREDSAEKGNSLRELCIRTAAHEELLRQGGGPKGIGRQRALGRLPVRERLVLLLDERTPFLELGLWAAWEMYREWGNIPAAGVVAGVGSVSGRDCMVIANDATVKAGAMFPQSVKKVLRAQRVAFENNLPLIYLVDSAGVFLPLQDEVFPDEDDFGRIFRNNSVLSASGLPQLAAIMGNCVAGGAYLPVLCDKIVMTEGSGLYIAAPSLVKAAIGEEIDAESLGGARMHAGISGTIDFREPDDPACLRRLRQLMALLPEDPQAGRPDEIAGPERLPDEIYDIVGDGGAYDMRVLLACVVDADSIQESKAEYAGSVITTYARIGGHSVGIIANQRIQTRSGRSAVEIGGVLYGDSADKAARFVMDCNQSGIPLVFFQDVRGFMVGKEAEASGILRSGAKLVNAVSNSVVPKITIVVGGSFGAGNYALCGKAYDPRFIYAWPNAEFAVMGPEQASETLVSILAHTRKRAGTGERGADDLQKLREDVRRQYLQQMDIRYGAARGWVDAVIQPHETRATLIRTLELVSRPRRPGSFHTGVLQV
jgi:3-methylcrotonyl-CoA carboxylase beta subunit